MSQKIAKKLREFARTSLKSSKLKGSERQYYMLNQTRYLGASEKEARRAVRVVCKKYDQGPPQWAKRLQFLKEQVLDKSNKLKKMLWRNVGLVAVA